MATAVTSLVQASASRVKEAVSNKPEFSLTLKFSLGEQNQWEARLPQGDRLSHVTFLVDHASALKPARDGQVFKCVGKYRFIRKDVAVIRLESEIRQWENVLPIDPEIGEHVELFFETEGNCLVARVMDGNYPVLYFPDLAPNDPRPLSFAWYKGTVVDVQVDGSGAAAYVRIDPQMKPAVKPVVRKPVAKKADVVAINRPTPKAVVAVAKQPMPQSAIQEIATAPVAVTIAPEPVKPAPGKPADLQKVLPSKVEGSKPVAVSTAAATLQQYFSGSAPAAKKEKKRKNGGRNLSEVEREQQAFAGAL